MQAAVSGTGASASQPRRRTLGAAGAAGMGAEEDEGCRGVSYRAL